MKTYAIVVTILLLITFNALLTRGRAEVKTEEFVRDCLVGNGRVGTQEGNGKIWITCSREYKQEYISK